MSGIRQTMVFALEDEYADTTPSVWYRAPPGSFFNSSFSRTVTSLYETGKKIWTDANFGKVSGTWQWTFPLDYNYLEPLLLIFEGYTPPGENAKGIGWATHRFYKSETGNLRSFTVRRKRLYRTVGAAHDEMTVLRGCVCTTVSFSQSGGSSPITVSMSGVYSTEVMDSDDDLELDPVDTEPVRVEYACVTEDDTAWMNVLNWQFQIQNNVTGVYGVGYPCIRAVYEGQTVFGFTMKLYSQDPKQLAQRAYNGGYDASEISPTRAEHGQQVVSGMPIPELVLKSASPVIEQYTDGSTTYTYRYSLDTVITNCVVNMAVWSSGDGAALTDSLSNGKCQEIQMEITNRFLVDYTQPSEDSTYWDGHLAK